MKTYTNGEAPTRFLTTTEIDASSPEAFNIGDNCLRATPASAEHIARARQARREIAARKAAQRLALHLQKGR